MSPIASAPGWPYPVAVAVVPGGAAGNHTVFDNIDTGDTLIAVVHCSANLVTKTDITSEFTITSAGVINNAAGTNTTGNFLVVVWRQVQ